MSSGVDIEAGLQLMKAALDKCQTKEDYEKFIRQNNNQAKIWMIIGGVLCLIGLFGLFFSDLWEIFLFMLLVPGLAVFLLVPWLIRPYIKEAEHRLDGIDFYDNVEHLKALTEDLQHDLSFVKEVSGIIFNRAVSDFEAKVLRKDFMRSKAALSSGEEVPLLLNAISSEERGMTKQDVRNDILNTLRTNDKVKDEFYSDFKTTIEDYYKFTNEMFSDDDIISNCSEIWFGGSGDKYHSEIKEMCQWLENEKGHILSHLIIDGDNGASIVSILENKKDIFLKLFNEWNSTSANVESNVINEESIEQPTVEAPKTPQEESNFGGIVLN